MRYSSQASVNRFRVLALIALPFLLMGCFMVAAGLGWIPVRLLAPGWVVAILGLPFIGGGLYILGIPWLTDTRNMTAAMLIVLAVIVTWAAFTDEPLCFTHKDKRRLGHVVCQEDTPAKRVPIIIAAAAIDIWVVVLVAGRLRRHFQKPAGERDGNPEKE
jgi:hypothetical protein